MSDKQLACNDLIRLINVQDNDVKARAAQTLIHIFSDVPDKQQVCEDLIELINVQDNDVKAWATLTLMHIFSDVPDKQQACNDLIRLTSDQDNNVRAWATQTLMHIFSDVPDKQQACNVLIRLIRDRENKMRGWVAQTLISVFSDLPDKQQAWNELYRFTIDEDNSVSFWVTYTLSSVYSYVPDKQQAWEDLHKLTSNKNSFVRANAASALGSVFSYVPDKQQACEDLHILASEEKKSVRVYANYSLGKVSIFKASQTEKEEDYKKELEKAIEFFEKAAEESEQYNPSQFCLPFYRSFYTIVFKTHETKEEVDKYLSEAKKAVRGSKNKELLFEAVENLSNSLKEVQSLGNLNLEAKKDELSFYRKYCDRAAELMEDTDKEAPSATMVLRKGLPILDRNLKETLGKIQEQTRSACKELKGTSDEETACAINKKVQELVTSNPEEAAQHIEDIAYTLKNQVSNIPEYILSKINLMVTENDITKKTQILEYIIGYIIGQMLKESNVSIEVHGNENNLIVNSDGSNIRITSDTTTKPHNFFAMMLEHPIISSIIATVIGGIILAFVVKKYFPDLL